MCTCCREVVEKLDMVCRTGKTMAASAIGYIGSWQSGSKAFQEVVRSLPVGGVDCLSWTVACGSWR